MGRNIKAFIIAGICLSCAGMFACTGNDNGAKTGQQPDAITAGNSADADTNGNENKTGSGSKIEVLTEPPTMGIDIPGYNYGMISELTANPNRKQSAYDKTIDYAKLVGNAITMRYSNEKRSGFVISNLDFELCHNLTDGTKPTSPVYIKATNGTALPVTMETVLVTRDGNVNSSAGSSAGGRVNIYRHGLYFYDVHILELDYGGAGTGETVREYSFAEKLNGFIGFNDVTKPVIKDGALYSVVTNAEDPYIFNSNIKVSAAEANGISIEICAPGAASCEVFFGTKEGGGFAPERSFRFKLSGTEEYEKYTIDASMMSANWTGTINAIRFDIDGQDENGEIYIRSLDFVKIISSGVPAKHETVYNIYPDKLHEEEIVRFIGDAELSDIYHETRIESSAVKSVTLLGRDGFVKLDGSLPGGEEKYVRALFIEFAEAAAGSLGFIYPEKAGDNGPVTLEYTDKYLVIRQHAEPKNGAYSYKNGARVTLGRRVYISSDADANSFLYEAAIELKPLTGENIKITEKSGVKFEGYNKLTGAYVFSSPGTGGFNYPYYDNPNYTSPVEMSITNDGNERRIYIDHQNGTEAGSMEAAVILDADGIMLPVKVQTGKNFEGEDEEPFYRPGDPAFTHAHFPVMLDANQSLKLTSVHLWQNWGNHALKQISSILFFTPYYHLSTGVTETTCWAPLLYNDKNGFLICDYRPMSGILWEGQPQHDTSGAHRLVVYRTPSEKNEAKLSPHNINYRSTVLSSVGPNYSDMTLNFETDGGGADVLIRTRELPQLDETRVFTHVRVDVKKAFTVDDAKNNFAIYELKSDLTGTYYSKYAYLDKNGANITGMIDFGEPSVTYALGTDNPYMAVYGIDGEKSSVSNQANLSVLASNFKAVISGKEFTDGLAVNIKTYKSGHIAVSLTLNANALEFAEGDFIDVDLILLPFGSALPTDVSSVTGTRAAYLENPVMALATVGTVHSNDVIPVIAADNEKAAFTIKGGLDFIGFCVEGFSDYKVPVLYKAGADGAWESMTFESKAGQNDGVQVYINEKGEYGFAFLFNTDGGEYSFKIQ